MVFCCEYGRVFLEVSMSQASGKIIADRKEGATRKAAERGHTITIWDLSDDRSTWVGKCSNKNCKCTVVVNTATNGGYIEVSSFFIACPYEP